MDANMADSPIFRRFVLFIAAAGTAMALLGETGCSGSGPRANERATTAPTGASTSSPTAATRPTSMPAEPIEDTDWTAATITIPDNTTGCAAGTAHFQDGEAVIAGTTYRMFARWQPAALYADFDQDQNSDAVVAIECLQNPAATNVPGILLVISGAADRHQLGMLASTAPRDFDPNGNAEREVQDLQLLRGPALRFTLRNYEGTGRCTMEYFWQDGSFAHRDVDHGEICG
jgi:hypothetical protein